MHTAFKGLALLVLTLSGQACHAQAQEPGWYVGGSVGGSRTKFNNVDFTLTPPVAGASESQTTNKTGSKFFAGYDFTRNWAVEGAFVSLGTPQYNYTGRVAGRDAYKVTSWNLAAKGTMPLRNKFEVFAKLGATSNRASSETAISGAVVQNTASTKTRADVLIGVGGAYNLYSNMAVRLEYESFGKFGNGVNQLVATTGQTGRANVGMWSVGMSYKF
jgi:OOP family OmpA-OmpF porin